MWQRAKNWLIVKLGGMPKHDCRVRLFDGFDGDFRQCVVMAVEKVRCDPSFDKYEGSNLGRNILRDEASEWTRLYLKELGRSDSEGAVHLACELYYQISKLRRQDAA